MVLETEKETFPVKTSGETPDRTSRRKHSMARDNYRYRIPTHSSPNCTRVAAHSPGKFTVSCHLSEGNLQQLDKHRLPERTGKGQIEWQFERSASARKIAIDLRTDGRDR